MGYVKGLESLVLEGVGLSGRAVDLLTCAMERGACGKLRQLTLARAGLAADDVMELSKGLR
eukprot:27517-Eustigmatos_ZCMA.PRE.1